MKENSVSRLFNHLPDETIRKFLHLIGIKHVEFELSDEVITFMNKQYSKPEEDVEENNVPPLGRMILSSGGNIVEANNGLEKILGQKHTELTGLQFMQFVSKGSKSTFISFLIKVRENKTIETCDIVVISDNEQCLMPICLSCIWK